MLRTLVAVAALAFVLPVGTPVLAQAQGIDRLTMIDDRGDTWRYPLDESPPVVAPRQRRNDIRRTVVRHGLHAVTIRARFSELSRRPAFYVLTVPLRTSAGVRREVSLFVDRETHWRGVADFMRPSGRLAKCAVAHRINYTRNVVRVRVPRSCLDDPRWIQANVFILGAFSRMPGGVYGDSAHGPQRPAKRTWTRRLHSPQAS
jgi:hypothetical protein